MSLIRAKFLWQCFLIFIPPVVSFIHFGSGIDAETGIDAYEGMFQKGNHTNNWAVLVCTSRFWFNYRHVANVLSLYHSVKRLGIPDSQIILMLSDDMPCNSRNPRPGTVYNNAQQHINTYGEDVEVDYRGYEVTVGNFIRVLTGRLPSGASKSKRLMTSYDSNILIYVTGHGGDGFLKFQDSEEITSVDLADAIEQMYQKNRYNEMLLIVDTCQAASMYKNLYSPNVIAVSSSLVGEDSLSHHVDHSIGVYIIDRYTYFVLEFLERVTPTSNHTLQEFLEACPRHLCLSTVGVRYDLFSRDPSRVKLTDFFGSVRRVTFANENVELSEDHVSWIPQPALETMKRRQSAAEMTEKFARIPSLLEMDEL